MQADIFTKTKSHCRYCVDAKALLEKLDIPYNEISVEDHRDACFARVRAASGEDPKTAPQIFIDNQYIGGHDQLVVWATERGLV